VKTLQAEYELVVQLLKTILDFLGISAPLGKAGPLRPRALAALQALDLMGEPRDPDVMAIMDGLREYIELTRPVWDKPE